MAAYSAVASFRQTLQQLLDSGQIPADLPKPLLESLRENLSTLQTSLDQIPFVPKNWRGKMNKLQIDIRDAIYEAQDKVEYSIRGHSSQISIKKVSDDIDGVRKVAEDTAKGIKNDPQAQNLFSENPPPPSSTLGKLKIFGQEEDVRKINEQLYSEEKQLQIIPITGLPGIGKTTLARSIYDDPSLKKQFNIRAWVTVSQDFHFQEIYSKLLSSMESKNYQAGHYTTQGDEQALFNKVYQELYNQRYLIVIDDMWDERVWDKVRLALPDKENGSRILLTTRIPSVAKKIVPTGFFHEMQLLNDDFSWKLLSYKAFDKEDYCPPHLKDTGLKIAKNCGGLPLSLTVVGGLLSREIEKHEYWKRIEEDTADAAAKGEDSYMEILSLSYNYLPGKLKGCFLYMAAFPEDSEIRASKLIKLWVAEGFLPASTLDRNVEVVARDSVKELIDRNLISVRKKSSSDGMKVCGMHDSLRELAEQESGKEKFFYSRKKFNQPLEDDEQIQRRVSIHRNILMCLEEVYDSTRTITYARSLLYVGQHHHHPMPFVLTFDLLRVLDAFTVYFIQFPDEFLELIHLTYLSFTYNGKISAKIAQLEKLQVIMVRREPKIIFVGASFLPDEIWKMPHLRHLWFTETDLPTMPPRIVENSPLLANLQTLSNVNAAFFDDEVLGNMPNLSKLVMWIEGPEPIKFDLSKMSKLEFFKFVVLNPIPGKGIGVEAEKFFPKTLRRLHLSGCGFPWEYMKTVAVLPDLEALKLRELAFHGREWKLDYKMEKLKFLLIEYLNFEKWEVKDNDFPRLQRLIMRHCYELKKIPSDIGFIGPLELIELVDCSPAVVESAELISEEQEGYEKPGFQVRIFSSWE